MCEVYQFRSVEADFVPGTEPRTIRKLSDISLEAQAQVAGVIVEASIHVRCSSHTKHRAFQTVAIHLLGATRKKSKRKPSLCSLERT